MAMAAADAACKRILPLRGGRDQRVLGRRG